MVEKLNWGGDIKVLCMADIFNAGLFDGMEDGR